MKHKYNISSKSDMRRFQRGLKKDIKSSVVSAIESSLYDVTCPSCGAVVNIPAGVSQCPECKKEINLELNINF